MHLPIRPGTFVGTAGADKFAKYVGGYVTAESGKTGGGDIEGGWVVVLLEARKATLNHCCRDAMVVFTETGGGDTGRSRENLSG